MKALRHILAGVAGIFAMVAFAGSASAGLVLLLNDDNNATFEVVVIDEQASGATDGSWTSNTADGGLGTDGAILYFGAVGSWNVVLSFGTSQPVLPSGEMDLTVSATSTGADTLSIWLIDTDFLTGGGQAFIEWALDAANNSTSTACGFTSSINSDNSFNAGTCIGPVGAGGFYTGAFNTGGLLAGVPFSMFINWIIVHTEAGQTTGDLRLKVPEPMTAALFGMGLLGLGAVRRRRKLAA